MASDDPTSDDGNETDGQQRPDDPADRLEPDDPTDGLEPDDPADGLEPDAPAVSDPSENLGPTIPDPAENDVDSELRRQFWTLVLLFNVALFGMSLGVMLVGFEGRWRVGGAIFAAGAVAFARGWRGYRQVTAEIANGE